MNRNKEVLVVTLTQFLASLETRPSAKAYKVSNTYIALFYSILTDSLAVQVTRTIEDFKKKKNRIRISIWPQFPLLSVCLK